MSGPRLGILAEPDRDGQPALDAAGDDRDGIDDEDGVVFASPLVRGETAEVVVSASALAVLDAWIDFSRDGVFDHPAEQVAVSKQLMPGENRLTFLVPGAVALGPAFARFRISTSGGLAPTGLAPDGEVEDHAVELVPFPASANLSIAKTADAYAIAPGGTVTYTLIVANSGPSDAHGVVITDILPQGATVVSAPGCTEGPSATLTFPRQTLLASESVRLTLTIQAGAAATGTLTNLATIHSDTPEANPGDEEARAEVPIVPPADLVVSMVNHQDPIIGGSNVVFTAADESGMQGAVPIGGAVRDSLVRYTITVRNDGPADAEDVVVTHMLPVGLSLLSDIGVRSLGTLRAGASVRYTIAAQTAPGVLGALTAQINARTASPEANPLDDPAP